METEPLDPEELSDVAEEADKEGVLNLIETSDSEDETEEPLVLAEVDEEEEDDGELRHG